VSSTNSPRFSDRSETGLDHHATITQNLARYARSAVLAAVCYDDDLALPWLWSRILSSSDNSTQTLSDALPLIACRNYDGD
jgi:hypothetical protein